MLATLKQALRARIDAKRVAVVRDLLAGQSLTLIDVGAAYGIERRWKPYAPFLHYIGFEPEPRAFSNIVNPGFASKRIVNKAIWSCDGPLTIHVCRAEGRSSHYPPNSHFVSRYPDASRFDVIDTITVPAVKLDSVAQQCDFIKIDTQGGELEILKGATGALRTCLGLQVEVGFLPIYREAPLFGDICCFLSDHGFEFIDFVNLCRWERDGFTEIGQCVFGDALFLRSDAVDSPQYRAILAIYDRLDMLQLKLNDHALDAVRATARRNRRIGAFVTNVLDIL